MKTICLYFQVHQPFRFRRYRFFDIGNDHYYYDDYSNESMLAKISEKSYLPTNDILLKLLKANKGKFKVAFSLSGLVIKQFQLYAPEVIESFQRLADTGYVEFLAETNCHSLVALKDKTEFERQVKAHSTTIKELFNQEPTVFRNTELIYSDEMGDMVNKMGYKAMLTEGAKHVLGWKSPNYLYCNDINPKLKVLLNNFNLSDDIAFRFGNQSWNEWPLTAEKYAQWLLDLDPKSEVINLFMNYETFGEHQWKETGIFEFLQSLPGEILKHKELSFSTPSEVVEKLQPISPISVPHPISWADEERDLTAWLGNEMQEEAFNKLYKLLPKIQKCSDPKLCDDWLYLQASDHFYYMCTKYFSDGDVHAYFNPYESPYQAFINYMNVLSDFSLRLNAAVPENTQEESISNLTNMLKEREDKIAELEQSLKKLRAKKTKKQNIV
ncbi:alpha-amylase [Saccharicrinis carchari]|uniref:Alpha-amylase n=1 Tax=Saccharicrinis carchari TaxID=1168039 RepID=A0A521C4X8_SACCC|nr:glycoside hydrolase family 57 protein [Saccharicrinis carchari]SMO53740.1 alpha-amylase [Saccharicrinis carchari]